MFGPGKYDDLLVDALDKANALQGLLIILDSAKGPGFSAKLRGENLGIVPRVLRDVANQIENDNKTLNKNPQK